jgi:uncharacterized RmlC-like cupin family protein
MIDSASKRIVRIRPEAQTPTRQRLPYFVGVSDTTAGASGISMNLAVIPPGASSAPHLHDGYETAIYLVDGRVLTYYGPGLLESVLAEAGDFLFIPAGMPHQAVNLSGSEPALAVVARNVAAEQESVVPYDPARGR